jgi:hypothetical protein
MQGGGRMKVKLKEKVDREFSDVEPGNVFTFATSDRRDYSYIKISEIDAVGSLRPINAICLVNGSHLYLENNAIVTIISGAFVEGEQ